MIKKIFFFSIFIFNITFSQTDTLLIFSEIMFSPTSGNNEFIEIYNLSSTLSVDLNGYSIKYYTSTADQLIDAGFGTTLLPNSYAIIFENDYDIATGIYNGLVPANALIIKIADNSFGASGMANTTSRPLWLFNSVADTVDYYFYSANNATAISDEKIILNRDSLTTNWANSLITNGTPGYINTVTPTNYDLQLSSLTFSPSIPVAGNDIMISAKVKNNGVLSAANYSIEIFNDINKDSVADLSERIFNQTYTNLAASDSSTATTTLSSLPANLYQIIARVTFLEDQIPANNILINQFTVSPPGNIFNDIVINEIMYAPSTGEPEWIEIYNKTANLINLKNWQLSDASTTITITSQNKFIEANSFLVISHDSSILNYYSVPSQIITATIPTLNNTGDNVVLKDFNSTIIDSVSYLPAWGGSVGGKSLERVSVGEPSNDPINWKSSASIFKATPGTFNSVTQKDFDLFTDDILYNPQFPLLGDNVNISASIKNIGKNTASFSIDLYGDTNLDSIPDLFIESISTLNLTAADSAVYQFTHVIQNIQDKKAFFIKVLFVQDQDTTNNSLYKTIEPGFPNQIIVVNEIMFAPFGGEPEWIELFNNSNVDINLKDWTIWDVVTTPAKATITQNFIIPANSYVVLTRDSSITNYHRYVPAPILELSLPSFNNDRDGVVLKDNRGLAIDSVFYSNQWGGTNGFSLERISSTAASNNQFNWASSNDIEQSTPGRVNSITPKEYDLSVSEISFSPRFPTLGENVSVTAKIKNNGNQSAQNFITEFYIDTDSNNVVNLLLSSVATANLNPGDSLSVTSTSQIQSLQNKILTAVRVIYLSDEDTLNNYFEKSIEPGFAQNIVKINEVMYNPADGDPEWVELVNTSTEYININNWFISDVLTTPSKDFITNDDVIIEPNEIFIVAKDTSFNSAHPNTTAKIFYSNFGSLASTADGVVIYDFRNGIIDSLFYRSSWGGKKGYSLERISLSIETNDSTNWVTSLDENGSTPGIQNSIFNVPSYSRNAIVINEIMYDPETNASEYVEFYNLSSEIINIGGWKFEDENSNTNKLIETSFNIPPQQYFILMADSSALTAYNLFEYQNKNIVGESSLGLVNTGELILLKDVRGNVIDSVVYNDKWNNKNIASTKGKSLERINPNLNGNDPLNWSTSVNSLGGTPGNQNSIFAENLNQSANISVEPNPFSPDNDGFEDYTVINYNLTQATAQVRIKIFDSKGRLVRSLINNKASGSNGSVIFDGLDDENHALRMGIYIIFLEALNDNSGVVETIKTVVVVARKL
ncbi:MAG: lamin tail domain-containing protein [Ignavibacteriales bacterium]|nr:lamin tail domain-containing protein [Ignavibacteriales bacterium]